MSGHCFYCGVRLKRRGAARFSGGRTTQHPDSRTTDHVVPASRAEKAGHPVDDPFWNVKNHVGACFACNNRKGDMWPLDWLQIVPDPDGAERLARLLVELGCPQYEVDAVMKLRPA